MATPRGIDSLPPGSSVLAVCAHPDDESFGLGAVLHRLAADGGRISVLCFTHGEASTLGRYPTDLGEIREAELAAAATELGVGQVELLDHPDGGLTDVPLDELVRAVTRTMDAVDADLLLVFDEGGVTGHPDHARATEAALAASNPVPVLAWGIPKTVGAALNAEFDTTFVERDEHDFDMVVTVDREAQRRAIAHHASQSTDNPVLWRRLELMADTESLRWLAPPSSPPVGAAAKEA
jgi:LmbE family N-acetylglucosaminyl deacetylase